MPWLIVLLNFSFAQTQPAAVTCAERFLDKMNSIKGYAAKLKKRELFEGEWLEEPVGLKAEGHDAIEYTFLADGSTGIKNNGMRLIYDGTDILKIIWGQPTFLGALANRAAKAVTGDSLPLTGETALKGELFTLNRAGLYHIARCLRHHLPLIKAAKEGGLAVTENCRLKYTPHELKYASVTLKPGDRVQDLEDKYGTYAFHIRQANADKFDDLHALFNRETDHELRVPEFLAPFEMELGDDGLPRKFDIYLEGQKLGEYTFTELKTW